MVTFPTPLAVNSAESKGSLGHAFAASLGAEKLNQAGFCPCALREVSGLAELALGHLRYCLTDVPPQSNSQSESFLGSDLQTAHGRTAKAVRARERIVSQNSNVPGSRANNKVERELDKR